MNETKQDIERRQRLQEWFKSDPEIWQDIVEECALSIHNETVQLKARTCTNRDWSSGYVAGQEFFTSMEKYYRRIWTAPFPQQK